MPTYSLTTRILGPNPKNAKLTIEEVDGNFLYLEDLIINTGGATGPLGPQGRLGNTGPRGPQGVRGFNGIDGDRGWQGWQGLLGFQGPQGLRGPQAFQGPDGMQGYQGYQGFQGRQGFQGFQGQQGFQGLTGPQGRQGYQGFQGFQGYQGLTGPQGQGFQGFSGMTGSQGFQGFQGLTGPQGFQGTGVQGYQGRQGLIGYQGLTGPQGLIGYQGLTGPQGGGNLQNVLNIGNSASTEIQIIDNNIVVTRGQITINDGDTYINGDTKGIIINDDINQKYVTLTSNSLRMQHTDGAGSVDYDLLFLSQDSLQFYDTGGSNANVDVRPNQYNNQLITLPDITGGIKTVGTWDETFSSGVIVLSDSRFTLGTPNFAVMITGTNSSTSIGVNYFFSVGTSSQVTITALNVSGAKETNDKSTVRITCFF